MWATDSYENFTEGIFVQELKNRFLCEVLINDISTVCYVPSSCHLSNFLSLKGKKVLLVPTKAPHSRTEYALLAVPYKKSYIILNTSIANRVLECSIASRRFSYLGKRKSVLKEYTIDGYKTDFFIKDNGTIIEVKSIISTVSSALFPTVYSERTQNQLHHIQSLLDQGYHAYFCIISLNPYVKSVHINHKGQFYEDFKKCLSMGMLATAYTCRLKASEISIDKQVPIIMGGDINV